MPFGRQITHPDPLVRSCGVLAAFVTGGFHLDFGFWLVVVASVVGWRGGEAGGGGVWGQARPSAAGSRNARVGPHARVGVWGRTVVAHVVGKEGERLWYNIGGGKQRL